MPVQGRLGYPRSPASRSNTYGDDNLCSAAMISSSLVRVGTLQGPPHCAGDFDLSRKACRSLAPLKGERNEFILNLDWRCQPRPWMKGQSKLAPTTRQRAGAWGRRPQRQKLQDLFNGNRRLFVIIEAFSRCSVVK